MADMNSALPIRSELVGQVVYQDIITKLGDATNPATQQAAVDTFGSQQNVLRDTAGNAIGDQLLSTTYWLQVVEPTNGPVAPGTAAGFSSLVGGVYNSTPITLTTGQQAALQVNSAGYLLVASSPASLGYDTNYGTVGADTLRTASEIGNATGAANFNYGAVGAQTLRVASQIGNATGAADFGAGATDAQTLRVSANQGTAAALSGAWPMEITDGTNGPAAVKAASIAALATDPALVVALSPNSPLPTGSNTIGSVNQGTSPWIVKDLADGSVGPGTAGTFSQLAGGVYNSTPITLTNGQQSALQLNASGALEIAATPASLGYDTNWGTVGATTLRTAAEIGNAAGAADFNYGAVGAQTLRVAAEPGNATGIADFNNGATGAQTLRVAANLAVACANVSNTNPVPVALVSSTPGTAIQDYHTSAALAAGASVTFTYTVVAAHTFNLERVWAAASGKIKALVQNNGSTIFVGFSSTANPNIDITVISPPTIAAGNTVTVTITNMDLLAFDVYATIEGNQN